MSGLLLSDKNGGVLFSKRLPRQVLPGSGPLVEMRAQFVDRGKAHHALRHLGLDRAIRIERIGHAIDDAGFEHRDRRLFLVAAPANAVRAARRQPARKVDGARPLRRCDGARRSARVPVSARRRRRSPAAASVGSAAGLGVPARQSAADGSAVRASARSRSLRDDEENSRLRRGLTAGGGWRHRSAGWASGAGDRARGLVLPWRGGSEAARGRHRWLPHRAGRSRTEPASWHRARRRSALTVASPRACGARRIRACGAMFFSSRPTIQRPSMIMPVQAATAPATISVLPKLNSLTGIPNPIASETGQQQANPGDQQHNHHRTHPRAAPETLAAANATIPSYCAHRQPAIATAGSATGHPDARTIVHALVFRSRSRLGRNSTALYLGCDCCGASGKLRHNSQLLGNGTALYGCRGTRPKSAKAGPQGTPGYQ